MNTIATPETDIDRVLRDKLRRHFREDMIENKEKHESERIRKLIEEKDFLLRIEREMSDERLKSHNKRQHVTNERLYDYQLGLEKKKQFEMQKLKEKSKEKDLVTLDFRSEEHMKNYKEYMVRLSDNVESNLQKHKQFLQMQRKPEHSPIDLKVSNQFSSFNYKKEINNENNNYMVTPNLPADDQHYSNVNQSDVTNIDYFSKKQNQEYYDYRNAQKEFLKYNKEAIESKERSRQIEMDSKKRFREQNTREIEKTNLYQEALRNYQLDQQKNYRNFLDGQIKDTNANGYNNHNLKRGIKSGNNYNSYSENDSYSNYANQDNNYNINNNLYKAKKTNLGESQIEHNPILNPVTNYRYNKYLFNSKSNSSLQCAGNSVIY